ncbi:MAG: hypothetical protein JO115_15035 [Pseudonocardiales bacterium]|nr:hypothetical protein [Pseudonocardiales bacterium]
MIESDVQTRIAEALEGRRSQRGFVDELASRWAALVAGFEGLVTAMEAADRSARDATQTADSNTRVREAVTGFLQHRQDGAGSAVELLRARLEKARQHVDAVCARVRRDTVNMGVIGSTRAGKSTLLRTITGLPDTVIPSSQYDPTTAAPSRIYHVTGQQSALLELHSWESFRDSYLQPLHKLAKLGRVPQTPGDFVGHSYPVVGSDSAGGAGADKYLRKLLVAQESFGSYEALLSGPRTKTVGLSELRPYVSYPFAKDPPNHRPYHAVRGTKILQQFPEVVAINLGLIDLPGAGESGLDVDRQFMQGLKNEIDLLLMIKRPSTVTATYLNEDSYALELADSARSGVALDDFYLIVINRDHAHVDPGSFENTLEQVGGEARRRGIRVVTPDVSKRDDVLQKLMKPALEHLATRLAEMDRAAVGAALDVANEVAEEVARFAGSVLTETAGLQDKLPDEEDAFRDRAKKLRDDIAGDLAELKDRYDSAVVKGEADAALDEGVAAAVAAACDWVGNGLGRGSREQWLKELRGPFASGDLEAKQEEYYRAKAKIAEIFGAIDISLEDAVRRLWCEVADVLRRRLTEELVPDSPTALESLNELARIRKARFLRAAVTQLCQLRIDYGSIVLRVTRPIIRKISWGNSLTGQLGSNRASGAVGTGTRFVADAAGMAVFGLPVASLAEEASEASSGSWWDRSSRPAATTPSSGAGEVAQTKRGAEGLYDELTAVVEQSISDLENALRIEARVMASVLAAAADQFLDTAIRRNDTERDYENLCRPNQRTIWPGVFDGGAARFAADLSQISEKSQAVLGAAAKVSDLTSARRLRPVAVASPG